MEAIDWIADKSENEGQFEVMREQMNYNYIYTRKYFVQLDEVQMEVVLLGNSKK